MRTGSPRGDLYGSIADGIRAGAHLAHPVSPAVLATTGMISVEERKVLAYCAAHGWSPDTRIVDGGCFVGASTRALIDGLKRNPHLTPGHRQIIHSYDLFRADAYMVDEYLSRRGIPLGGSYEALFLEHVRPDEALVVAHPGDVRDHPWTGGPIGILFLDMIWSWDINAFVVNNFYRNLSPAGALVLHQDYVYAWYPWLPVSMELFREHFEFIAFVPLATAVFRFRKPLDEHQLALDPLRDLGPEALLTLMSRAVDRFSGWPRGVLECSRASLLRFLGRTPEARAYLDDIARRYEEFEAPVRFARDIAAHIDSGAQPRLV